MSNKLTTPEIDEYIHTHYKGVGPKEMTEKVNNEFGTSYTREQIKAYYARNKLDSGLRGYFTKGHIPVTKGMKQTDYMSPEAIARTKATRFKKGNIPHNGGTPVGEIRLRKRQKRIGSKPYYWIKIEQPNKWTLLHQHIWEEANGPIPKGSIVTFADGNTLNCKLENLLLSTKAQHVVKNNLGLKGYDVESGQILNLMADIKMASIKLKKNKGKKRQPRGE